MSPEKEELLYDAYPTLYQDKNLPSTQSLVCFGFECDDGWFDIINRLSDELVHLDPEVKAVQIKEKYGTLHFYVNSETPEVSAAISRAEKESAYTCEDCGAKDAEQVGKGWIYTRCQACAKNLLLQGVVRDPVTY